MHMNVYTIASNQGTHLSAQVTELVCVEHDSTPVRAVYTFLIRECDNMRRLLDINTFFRIPKHLLSSF